MPKLENGMETTGSLMFARVGLRPDIPSAIGVMSYLINMLTEGNVHERLKSSSTSVHLLA